MTHYVSTRGGTTNPQRFTDVVMEGLAPDGGLYIPQQWPHFSREQIADFSGMSYAAIAGTILTPFLSGDLDAATLQKLLDATYKVPVFDHSDTAPLLQLAPNTWLLELFHGPTFSFKDYALQFIGRLFDHLLAAKGERITIVGATSGDTGSAAIAACAGCKHIDIVILHPRGRTSDIQRKQMTTVDAPNVTNIAIEGTFDDCQALVKGLFNDPACRAELRLAAVNSINWARILAQTIYYFAAATSLGAPTLPISFTVPTGNFGNVFAGWAARRMGLPIEQLVVASNRNDILTRFFAGGEMRQEKTVPSLSPSMDIQVSSNFERYLCELTGRDFARTRALMEQFGATGTFAVDAPLLKKTAQDFAAARVTDEETLDTMRAVYADTNIIIDPHTAVAIHAAKAVTQTDTPMVILSTAHPAKFPDAVYKALSITPPIPELLAAVLDLPEKFETLPNDLTTIKAFLRRNSRL